MERLDVEGARLMAEGFLAEVLPRRWAHTVAVAAAAVDLAKRLASQDAEEIVCAAWLHDIGYAPGLVDSGFHPSARCTDARVGAATGYTHHADPAVAKVKDVAISVSARHIRPEQPTDTRYTLIEDCGDVHRR